MTDQETSFLNRQGQDNLQPWEPNEQTKSETKDFLKESKEKWKKET